MMLTGGIFGFEPGEKGRVAESYKADLKRRAIEKLRALQHACDLEATHVDADKVLCELLSDLGYDDVVEEWKAVPKWYS